MPQHPKTVTLSDFAGLNNVLRPERTDPKYLKEATNVDIDKSGGVHLRLGYTSLDSGSYHSLWSDEKVMLAVKDGTLVKIKSDRSVISLGTTIGTTPISYASIGDKVYIINNKQALVYENDSVRRWGIDVPTTLPTLTQTVGNLIGGQYQIATSFVAADGRESGRSTAAVITIDNDTGILITNLPVSSDSQVTKIRVYITPNDGDIFYHYGDLNNGVTTALISDTYGLVEAQDTFRLMPPPLGTKVKYFNGRLYIQQGNLLWYSDKWSYELFDLTSNFLQFEEEIIDFYPVDNGMWVGTETKLYWLSGREPSSMRRDLKELVTVVSNTGFAISGAYIFIENTPIGYKWLVTTSRGIFVLFNDGIALSLTEKNIALPTAEEGSALFIQTDGINRYVSLLKNPSDSQNAVVGDVVTAEVIRNGISI